MTAPTGDAWTPGLYERFRAEREQPFHDLVGLVERRPAMRVLDLGCGSGRLTEMLHHHLRAAETVGIDDSEAMLAAGEVPRGGSLRVTRADIASHTVDAPVDLVFSNAALHWLPDHQALLTRMRGWLAPGGQLAVQVPAMEGTITHRASARLAGEAPFRDALGGFVLRYGTLAPEAYSALLHRLDFARQHVRLQVYPHLLPSREAVVEWVRGTHLTAYQRRLPADLFATFLSRYGERVLAELPDERPFLFTFRRLLLWGGLD